MRQIGQIGQRHILLEQLEYIEWRGQARHERQIGGIEQLPQIEQILEQKEDTKGNPDTKGK